MTLEQLAILAALLTQTAALAWWGARLSAKVERHGEWLDDHEDRLRKGDL